MAKQDVFETAQDETRGLVTGSPIGARERSRFRQNGSSEATARAALRAAIDQKGLDARALDLHDVSDVADYFVIVSGTSDRHVRSLADKIKLELKKIGETPNTVSGYDSAEWILLDYGDVVVHVFYEPTRQFYEFDELWATAIEVPIDPELENAARMLRTGIYR